MKQFVKYTTHITVAFVVVCCMLLLPACADEPAVQETETMTTTETTTEATTKAQSEHDSDTGSGEVPPNAEELLVPSQDEIDDAMLHDAQEAYDQYMMEMMEQEDSQYPAHF